MLNYILPNIPSRDERPRNKGITSVIDTGLSLIEAEGLCEFATYVDFVKIGFGSALVTPKLKEKVELYRESGINTYFGGSLFEAFITHNQWSDFLRFIDSYQLEYLEISDGIVPLDIDVKCKYIKEAAKDYKVISEVGSKLTDDLTPEQWVASISKELEAGSIKVICEARENGNKGIYGVDGSPNMEIISLIQTSIDLDKIIWESPQRSQQAWFIKNFSANVNLGNIASVDVIGLESLRLGLRADTMLYHINQGLKS